jgi:hypothetical protein
MGSFPGVHQELGQAEVGNPGDFRLQISDLPEIGSVLMAAGFSDKSAI